MFDGKYVFSQIANFVPRRSFDVCVKRYNGNKRIRTLSCHDQFLSLSTTTDNGIENKGHKDWDVSAFFADPHSPWQKPLVESSIGLLRRWFFKKGTDWSTITEKELQEAFSTLNNKYRKSLNYASALEVALAHGIIKSDPNKKSCI